MGTGQNARRARLAGASALTIALATAATIAPGSAQSISGVTVQAQRAAPLDRLPQPIEEQPQTVHVIDEEMLQEQAVTTLDRAVRNVPGITANTGEGGGAVAGDQFRIRGFDAQNDISSDGLRDFGVYTRDTFNVESVQIFLGPSGTTFGRGSFGGAINTSSKFARSEADFTTVQGSIGTAELVRGILDWNRALGEHTAARVNLMGHHSQADDIDEVQSDRWGAAGAVGWGLGTDTTFEVMYFHQEDDRVPYYGVPVSAPPGQTIAQPLPVDRSNFYGTSADLDDTQADVLTAKFMHEFSDTLRVHNDTRVGFFARDFMAVAPSCNNTAPSTCLTSFFDGDPNTVPLVTRGGASAPYSLDQWGAQNITTLIWDVDAGGLRHQVVGGVDMMYETSARLNRAAYQPGGATFPRPPTNAYNPDPTWNNPAYIATNEREADSTTFALFASDQVWFTDEFSVLAGVRWDRYNVNSELTTFGAVNATTGVFTPTNPNTVAASEVSETLFSPRVSLIWEPREGAMAYLSWSLSAQPATGTALASVGTPITAGQEILKPTTSETIEAGVRWPVFREDLLLGVSVFQIERDNSKETDAQGSLIAAGDEQEATGFELSLDGQITDRWGIQASYTFLDTETVNAVTSGAPNLAAIGKPIPFASENSATFWTTYQATDALELGLGARYADEVWLNNTNTAQAPEYISVDALASYEFGDALTLQLNGTNLLDREENYDQVAGTRAAHAPGRAFVVSLTKTF